jgi:hypothetical protein
MSLSPYGVVIGASAPTTWLRKYSKLISHGVVIIPGLDMLQTPKGIRLPLNGLF